MGTVNISRPVLYLNYSWERFLHNEKDFAYYILIAGTCCLTVRSLHKRHADLLGANIEALTQDEAIAVKVCNMENNFVVGNFTWFLKCDERTTSEMIYKCPDTDSFGMKGVSSLCIK